MRRLPLLFHVHAAVFLVQLLKSSIRGDYAEAAYVIALPTLGANLGDMKLHYRQAAYPGAEIISSDQYVMAAVLWRACLRLSLKA